MARKVVLCDKCGEPTKFKWTGRRDCPKCGAILKRCSECSAWTTRWDVEGITICIKCWNERWEYEYIPDVSLAEIEVDLAFF